MRTENSIKNAIISIIMNVINIFIGFIAQKVFIQNLGNEYLGLNGLFSNILSMLAIVELGFGSAIIYHLYKPISLGDKDRIKVLMDFYKKAYNIIASVIFFLGILMMLFLNKIVGSINIQESIYLLYFLALVDIVISYLLTYKRSILYADQKNYIINLVHIIYIILLNITQIIVLYITKSYIFYLISKIIFRGLENLIITIISNKMYAFIRQKTYKKLDVETKNDIFLKIKGLLFHKIGGAVVNGTDNIIISMSLGVETVGLFSNYNLIITAITTLLGQVFSSITATVGNLLVEKNKKEAYNTYRNILFANSWLYSFCGICLLCLIEPFITIWIGKEYLLSTFVLIVLVIKFYIQGMRQTNNVFKEASGIFHEDRYIPIIESLVNIVASIILVKYFGLSGVFIGTILSAMVLYIYSYPKYIYKKLFDKKCSKFFIEHLKYLLIFSLVLIITFVIIQNINFTNIFINFICKFIGCIIIPNLLQLIIFYRTKEFKYFLDLFIKIYKKVLKK